jgi:hypothetical protein
MLFTPPTALYGFGPCWFTRISAKEHEAAITATATWQRSHYLAK